MKYQFFFISLFVTLGLLAQKEADYKYTFEIEGYADSVLYLANYYGHQTYMHDTAYINKNGMYVFEGKGEKPGGLYLALTADKKDYFEFVLTETKFKVKTKKSDMVGAVQFEGSPENDAYYKFVRFMTKNQNELRNLKAKVDASEKKKEKEKAQKELDELNEKIEAFRVKFVKDNKDKFASKVLTSTKDPVVPDLKLADGSEDKEGRYAYYKTHFFDNMDFTDERMLRTPVFSKRIEYYLDKVVPQIPDSVVNAVVGMVDKSGEEGLIFKFLIQWSTMKFEKSKIMGMDAVFVGIAEKYYAKGKCFWLDEKKEKEIVDRYNVRKNLIIGVQADNIILQDTAHKWHQLYDLKSDYTVLVFWDPHCGHCKKEVPKIEKFYKEWKEKSVEVFGVSTDFENDGWKDFIDKQSLSFVNVSDYPELNKNAIQYIRSGETTLNSLNFRDYWDTFATPQIYVLDKDKKIIAKRITADQLGNFITNFEKRSNEGERKN